jgi:large subunit ribosomal protein L3
MNHILGIKKGMTRVFDGRDSIPVTVVDVGSCKLALKSEEGYEIGIDEGKGNKALQGKYKELGYVPKFRTWVSEVLGDDYKVGDDIPLDSFEKGASINVSGVSKGKGFAGVVKRWGFAGGPKTHGQSDRLRAPGSIGAGTDPGRVLKGKKMPGRKGGAMVTHENKKVVEVKDNYILVSGPVPGAKGSVVLITSNNKE